MFPALRPPRRAAIRPALPLPRLLALLARRVEFTTRGIKPLTN